MFEELLRELRRLEGARQISVSLPADAEGYLDRECPAPECLSQFKVHEDDWQDKVRDEEVFCPFCRHAADSQKWLTQEQVEHARQAALAHVGRRISDAMTRDAQRWNRQQPRDSFLRITMQVNDRPTALLLPPAVAEPMRLKITCPACSCRYAVIGAAFFCPACGHNAADMMFGQSLAAILSALDSLSALRAAIADRDTAETTARLIIENGLQNVVTTFQRYAEVLYGRCAAKPPRRNAFQNLSEGSDLWRALTGKHYRDYLGTAELGALTQLFQQRHLLAHTQGLVDADYIARSGDTTYGIGQRLVIREANVRESIELVRKLALAMESELARKSSK